MPLTPVQAGFSAKVRRIQFPAFVRENLLHARWIQTHGPVVKATRYSRWNYVLMLIVALMAGAGLWFRLQPRLMAESVEPRFGNDRIRILEVQTSFLDALLLRYNPTYRFEYWRPNDYLWSAQSYVGESYNARTASISWDENGGAVCSLDERPCFVLTTEGFWSWAKSSP